MTISEMIEKLEKIKEEHGDLPVKIWNHEEYSVQYYLDDADLEYYNDDEEECVAIGE